MKGITTSCWEHVLAFRSNTRGSDEGMASVKLSTHDDAKIHKFMLIKTLISTFGIVAGRSSPREPLKHRSSLDLKSGTLLLLEMRYQGAISKYNLFFS